MSRRARPRPRSPRSPGRGPASPGPGGRPRPRGGARPCAQRVPHATYRPGAAHGRRLCCRAVKHTLSVLTENVPGVLSRVSGLFTRRGFNIDSLAVSPTEDAERSRMTITVDASRHPIEQVTKQLDKLINVIKVRDLDPENMVSRELMLLKVRADSRARSEVVQLVEIFEAKI